MALLATEKKSRVALPLLLLAPAPTLRFALFIAALTSDPPVPFNAEIAKLAVSSTASVTVAFPLMNEDSVSDADRLLSIEDCHRSSNQSALKSIREAQKAGYVYAPLIHDTTARYRVAGAKDSRSEFSGTHGIDAGTKELSCDILLESHRRTGLPFTFDVYLDAPPIATARTASTFMIITCTLSIEATIVSPTVLLSETEGVCMPVQ
ncbi:hypothetical protein LTR35_012373 [Friedmanniomyces endolithicus]|nr:hypothetical protein LTR35_012373 [Friedmanniomyces endolithicus]KAK0281380.1 hypothetical protein LTS00_012589 [Friedmanniomyces endolithicus]KAK1015254.1 hypothetical protein LTR54_003797 [Friedmanniomyces endolithicus]